MRALRVIEFLSLDGVMQAPGGPRRTPESAPDDDAYAEHLNSTPKYGVSTERHRGAQIELRRRDCRRPAPELKGRHRTGEEFARQGVNPSSGSSFDSGKALRRTVAYKRP
jgi:hypothetical protein